MRAAQSILQREGMRKLPGVCWYPAKRTEVSVKQGGTANRLLFVLAVMIVCTITARIFLFLAPIFALKVARET